MPPVPSSAVAHGDLGISDALSEHLMRMGGALGMTAVAVDAEGGLGG